MQFCVIILGPFGDLKKQKSNSSKTIALVNITYSGFLLGLSFEGKTEYTTTKFSIIS